MPDPHNKRGPLSVSPQAHVSPGVYIDRSGGIVIEDEAILSEGVRLITHAHDMTPWHRADESRITVSPLVVRKGAFLGYGVIVLPGCDEIGEWAVVGAGAVVTHDVPAREIWAGVPARRIGVVE